MLLHVHFFICSMYFSSFHLYTNQELCSQKPTIWAVEIVAPSRVVMEVIDGSTAAAAVHHEPQEHSQVPPCSDLLESSILLKLIN